VSENILHGHLDQWDEFSPLTTHAHSEGDKRHRHQQKMVGGIRPNFRWVPPTLLARPFVMADWSDTSDL
jgi:hypothetical protein